MLIKCKSKANVTQQNDYLKSEKKQNNFYSLVTNQDVIGKLDYCALVLDKLCMSSEKLLNWLSKKQAWVVKCSRLGTHGCIVQCKDERSLNSLLQGHPHNNDDFLKVQSMAQRKGNYSRVVWLEINGIPFEWGSMESILSVAKGFTEILYVPVDSCELHQANSLFCLTGVSDPMPIQNYGFANISNDHSIPVWVTEVNYHKCETTTGPILSVEELSRLNEELLNNEQVLLQLPNPASPRCTLATEEQHSVHFESNILNSNLECVTVEEGNPSKVYQGPMHKGPM
ncbi:hypothetical protein Tco_0105280 [Tanacetum coccineum]